MQALLRCIEPGRDPNGPGRRGTPRSTLESDICQASSTTSTPRCARRSGAQAPAVPPTRSSCRPRARRTPGILHRRTAAARPRADARYRGAARAAQPVPLREPCFRSKAKTLVTVGVMPTACPLETRDAFRGAKGPLPKPGGLAFPARSFSGRSSSEPAVSRFDVSAPPEQRITPKSLPERGDRVHRAPRCREALPRLRPSLTKASAR